MKRMVIALGGNAIQSATQRGTTEEQLQNIERSLEGIIAALTDGWSLVITHGNGPQVGAMLLMAEAAGDEVPVHPLHLFVADTEGALGYLIQQGLHNRLRRENRPESVITIVTQAIVDRGDPALSRPTKPIGPFYSKEEAERLSRERGWPIVEDSRRGYRRVVPSPRPREIVEGRAIAEILGLGILVIAAGGGGVPVVEGEDGRLKGVDAVVDKDFAAGLLAQEVRAERLVLLTGTEFVSVDYGGPNARALPELRVSEAKQYLAEGQFPPGSMGPKIEAAIAFVESGGDHALITSIDAFARGPDHASGTRVIAG